MGTESDLLIIEETQARLGPDDVPSDSPWRVCRKRLTDVEIATLWMILRGDSLDDVERFGTTYDSIEEVWADDDRTTFRVPDELLDRLLLLKSTELRETARKWNETEELADWGLPADKFALLWLEDLVDAAKRARAAERHVFLTVSA